MHRCPNLPTHELAQDMSEFRQIFLEGYRIYDGVYNKRPSALSPRHAPEA